MIPQFPIFKPLSFEDKEEIDKKNIPPYSDFVFSSLWCWNTEAKFATSLLHGNLVVRMQDYTNHSVLVTFLGKSNIKNTAGALLTYSKETLGKNELQFVPEYVATQIKQYGRQFTIVEDKNQFDYIYSTQQLARLEGKKYHKKRNLAKRFEKENNPVSSILNLADKRVQQDIKNLCKIWLIKNRKMEQIIKDSLLRLNDHLCFLIFHPL